MKKTNVAISIKKDSYNDELGIIWGFASVADVIDLQDDVIPQVELEKAVYDFMESYYQGSAEIKENHSESANAILVESSLMWIGGKLRWYVGVKLLSEDLKELARSGEIKGFSIGGRANAEEI